MNYMLDARCPCPHCKFEKTYDEYLEIMKDQAVNMSADYIPDRPGF